MGVCKAFVLIKNPLTDVDFCEGNFVKIVDQVLYAFIILHRRLIVKGARNVCHGISTSK